MRRSPSHLKKPQLELFYPSPNGPDFRMLAPEVKQRTVQLLAQLLREHHEKRTAAVAGREARDE